MSKASQQRGEQVLTDVIRTLDESRVALAQWLSDFEGMRKRGSRLMGSVRTDLERRVRPRSRRRVPPAGGIAGVVVLGLALAGAAYLLYDRERRSVVRSRVSGMQDLARERYAELTGGRPQSEVDLESRVMKAISDGGQLPDGLEVVVEGRTVYLRGAVPDPAFVDAAAERVHGVEGVAAVVNLTTARTALNTEGRAGATSKP